jgi:hypothetical protein
VNAEEAASHSKRVERNRFDDSLWEGVGRLLDRSISVDDLRSHGLQLLAVQYWGNRGWPIPKNLVRVARTIAVKTLAAPLLLRRVRECCDGPIILLKGPETAACYPQPFARGFRDLDVLVHDVDAAQRTLIAGGFRRVGGEWPYVEGHQVQPVFHPDFPLAVDLHRRLHWVEGIPSPRVEELFETAIESVVPVSGILTLPRVQHAVLHAAHAWAHEPLGSIRQLIDVAATCQGTSPSEVETLAANWGIRRIWRTTRAAIDALFFGTQRPWALQVWARNLHRVRGRTVLETHLGRWFAGFSAFQLSHATCMALLAIRNDFRPMDDEDWSRKLRRMRAALKNTFMRRFQHDAEIDRAGMRARQWSEL